VGAAAGVILIFAPITFILVDVPSAGYTIVGLFGIVLLGSGTSGLG
jgi:hypothetical protein